MLEFNHPVEDCQAGLFIVLAHDTPYIPLPKGLRVTHIYLG